MTNIKNIEERLGKALDAIVARGEYPSGARISREMGRRTKSLNGTENRVRRRLMKARNIHVRTIGWNDYEPEIWW